MGPQYDHVLIINQGVILFFLMEWLPWIPKEVEQVIKANGILG